MVWWLKIKVAVFVPMLINKCGQRLVVAGPLPYLYKLNPANKSVSPVLGKCWASVVDGGPALNQHWVKIMSLKVRYDQRTPRLRQPGLEFRILQFMEGSAIS